MHFNGEIVYKPTALQAIPTRWGDRDALAMLFCSFVRNLSIFPYRLRRMQQPWRSPAWERVPALFAAGLGRSTGRRLRQLLEYLRRQQLLWLFGAFIAQRHRQHPSCGDSPTKHSIRSDLTADTYSDRLRISHTPAIIYKPVLSFLPQYNQASINSRSSYAGHLTTEFNLTKNAFPCTEFG